MINLRKCIVVVCIALIVVTAATTSASDVVAIVLVPLDPLFGSVIVAVPFAPAGDDRLPSAPALSVQSPRAPPTA